MHLRSALLLLAAAVAVTKTEALQADQPPALGVEDAYDPGQKGLQTGDSVREERQSQVFEVYNALKTSAFAEYLKAEFSAGGMKVPNFVHGWVDVNSEIKLFSNQDKTLILDFLSVLAQKDREALNHFMEKRDALTVLSIAKRLASTNNQDSRYIAGRLRLYLKRLWRTQQRSADYVFNLLQIDKSVSKAQKETTIFAKATCLYNDPEYKMWTAFVHRIHKHDYIETISRILVPAHFGIEEWKKILATAEIIVGPSTRRELAWGVKSRRGAMRKGHHEENTGVYAVKRLRVKLNGRYVENDGLGAL